MKTYMTDRRIPRDDGTWYTPYQQDADDIARRRKQEPWIVTKILVAIFIPVAIFSAFVVSPLMGGALVCTMLFMAFKPSA